MGVFFLFTCGLPTPHGGSRVDRSKANRSAMYSPSTPVRLAVLGGRAPLLPAVSPDRRAHCADSPLQWAEPPRSPPPPARPCSACRGRSWGPVEVAAAACRVRLRPLWGRVGEDGFGDGLGSGGEAAMVLGSRPELSSCYLRVRAKEPPGK